MIEITNVKDELSKVINDAAAAAAKQDANDKKGDEAVAAAQAAGARQHNSRGANLKEGDIIVYPSTEEDMKKCFHNTTRNGVNAFVMDVLVMRPAEEDGKYNTFKTQVGLGIYDRTAFPITNLADVKQLAIDLRQQTNAEGQPKFTEDEITEQQVAMTETDPAVSGEGAPSEAVRAFSGDYFATFKVLMGHCVRIDEAKSYDVLSPKTGASYDQSSREWTLSKKEGTRTIKIVGRNKCMRLGSQTIYNTSYATDIEAQLA